MDIPKTTFTITTSDQKLMLALIDFLVAFEVEKDSTKLSISTEKDKVMRDASR